MKFTHNLRAFANCGSAAEIAKIIPPPWRGTFLEAYCLFMHHAIHLLNFTLNASGGAPAHLSNTAGHKRTAIYSPTNHASTIIHNAGVKPEYRQRRFGKDNQIGGLARTASSQAYS